MARSTREFFIEQRTHSGQWLSTALGLGGAIPLMGTLFIGTRYPDWRLVSQPLHTSLEVAGATLGLVLAALLLLSQEKTTTRRMWIALALIAMAVFDIFHSCTPEGRAFIWFRSLSVLTGGLFFALVWFPDRPLSRTTVLVAANATLLASVAAGTLITTWPQGQPLPQAGSPGLSPADITALAGGLLILMAALNFAVNYNRTRQQEELLFLLLALLFGISGMLFSVTTSWKAGWWFWHLLRFSGYLIAFLLALVAYRKTEQEMLRTHAELDTLFHVGVDGKRMVDSQFNQVQANDTLAALAGSAPPGPGPVKCYESFGGPLCHTDACPLTQMKSGATTHIHTEVEKKHPDGSQAFYLLNAMRLEKPDGTFGGIIESFWDITDRKKTARALEDQNDLKTGQAQLSHLMQSESDPEALCRRIITFLCKYLGAVTGLIYLADETGTLRLVASYAHKRRKHLASAYRPGEGLVGQAALEKEEIILTQVPEGYITIESGLGTAAPTTLCIKPVIRNDQVKAVLELGTLTTFSESQSQFLDLVTGSIALAVENTQGRTRLALSLEESEKLSEELRAQQEELRQSNEELEGQASTLLRSEERLKEQQEELKAINEELEEKNELLQRQAREMLAVKRETEEKAEALALASSYKSEFLANMSHELRTPLNSLLLLARSLADNKEETLTPGQVESAEVIHASGTDLLNLINDILDLSKIEAGRMELAPVTVDLKEFTSDIQAGFRHLAREKGLELVTSVSPEAPTHIVTDRKRLDQIINNLMANAIKFTASGRVTLTAAPCPEGVRLLQSKLTPQTTLALSVTDTGIGIEESRQQIIFDAFQQADGTTTRRYGGTGLGLSIARKLATLLGGEIQLTSQPGKGATFTLFLPVSLPSKQPVPEPIPSPGTAPSPVQDDREALDSEDRSILVIEDDPVFARHLCTTCRDKGFKCLAAPSGEEGLALLKTHLPCAVLLDITLPGMDGWAVLTALKEDLRTRHIPVHIISAHDAAAESLRLGAVGHATKPMSTEALEKTFSTLEEMTAQRPKHVLVVDDNRETRQSVVGLIGCEGVRTTEATSASEAMDALRGRQFHCIILDLGLPDMDGLELLRALRAEGVPLPPVIIYTARNLTAEQEMGIREHADAIIVKDVRSQERLLDEVSLFLHQVVSRMPDRQKQIITTLHDTDALLRDKKVLIVDDDMRATFALSKLLRERGMIPLKADNGERALKVLSREPDLHLVLMDVMMPVMDGFETIRRIRAQEALRNLPIIALTAKAMKEDRTKCLASGASDYMPKPVDPHRLISMMRVWLHR